MFRGSVAGFFLLLVCSTASAEIHFVGLPDVRLSINEGKAIQEEVPPEEKSEYAVVITKEGMDFFWASRGDKPLRRIRSGATTIFLAEDGSGYIRLVDDAVVGGEIGFKYKYTEHLPIVINSVTYVGHALPKELLPTD